MTLTDLMEAVEGRLAGQVDLLLFNPPYVPSPPEEARPTHHVSTLTERFTCCKLRVPFSFASGGRRRTASILGRRISRQSCDRSVPAEGAPVLDVNRVSTAVAVHTSKTRRSCCLHLQVPGMLSPEGVCLLLAITQNDVPELKKVVATHGLTCDVVLVRSADEEKLHILKICRAAKEDQ